MKKIGLVLILIIAGSFIPTSALDTNTIFETSFGVVNVGLHETTVIDGERSISDSWTLEKMKDTGWIKTQLDTSILSAKDIDKVIRKKSDGSTNLNIEYLNLYDSIKILVDTTVNETGFYRLIWELNGGVIDFIEETYILFESGYKADWSDVLDTIGDIYEVTVTETGIKVTFLIGDLKEGEKFILDPTIGTGVASNVIFPRKNHLFKADSGRYYAIWNEGSTRLRYSYSNDSVTWLTPINPPSIGDGNWVADTGFNGTHFSIAVSKSSATDDLKIFNYEDTVTGLNLLSSDNSIYNAGAGQDIDDVSVSMTDFDNIWVAFELDIGASSRAYLLNGQMVAGNWVTYAGFPELLTTETGTTYVSVNSYGAESAKASVYEVSGDELRIYDEVRTGAVKTLEFTDLDVLGGGEVRTVKMDNTHWSTLCGTEYFNSTGGGVWVAQGIQILDDSEMTFDGTNTLFYAVDNAPDGVFVQQYDNVTGFRGQVKAFDISSDTSDYLALLTNTSGTSELLFTFTNATSTYVQYERYDHNSSIPTVLSASANASVSFNMWFWLNVTVQHIDGHAFLSFVDTQVNTTGDAENYTIRWTQTGDVFTEHADPSNIVTLNNGTSTALNATAMFLSMNLTMTGGQDGDCDVLVSATAVDAIIGTSLFPALFHYQLLDWTPVGDALNSAFSFWGITGFMDKASAYISGLSVFFTGGLLHIVELTVQQMRLMLAFVDGFIKVFTNVIDVVLNLWNGAYSIVNDTNPLIDLGIGNFWTWIAFGTWAQGFYLILVIFWIDGLDKRAKGTGRNTLHIILQDVNQLINLTSFFVSTFAFIVNEVANWSLRLFDAITGVIPI